MHACADARSLRDIGAEYWAAKEGQTRERVERLVEIDGFKVLKQNNYSMLSGEPSVFAREAAGWEDRCNVGGKKIKRQVRGMAVSRRQPMGRRELQWVLCVEL